MHLGAQAHNESRSCSSHCLPFCLQLAMQPLLPHRKPRDSKWTTLKPLSPTLSLRNRGKVRPPQAPHASCCPGGEEGPPLPRCLSLRGGLTAGTARSVVQPPSPEAIPVQEEWPTLPKLGESIGECFPGPPPHPTVVLLTLV